ncbi:hypothetical protein ATCVMO0605SPH_394L [Acanthocystis turfacea Chlorella virus MO0605SPH]|nr:hypothetical protein ATCVMO0605SPH_394L [Acanthocystis turfacea Chlorella virus MO0605SPH]
MFPMFPSGTVIKSDVLFPSLPDTMVAPIRPMGNSSPVPNPAPIQSQETIIVEGTIVDANPKAVRVSFTWPNGQVVNPIIPGDNTYTTGDDVDVVIKSAPPYDFVRLIQLAPVPKPAPVPRPAPSPVPKPTPAPSSERSDAGLKPTIVNIDGRSQIYQSPKNAKGLVVFLHGCSRTAFGGWPMSSGSKFFGMPEDVGRTKQCLANGYAILYLSPAAATGCFSAKTDANTAIKSINQVRSSLGLQGKPLYLGGCSAGGGMIQRLVADGSIQCNGMFNESATSADPSRKTPPSLWTVLSTPGEKARAEGHVKAMKGFGIPAAVLVSGKRVITPDYFYNQYASISMENSKKIAASLRSSGLIDANGNIVKDPKQPREWFMKLQKDVRIPETSAKFWNSGIVQELMTAYAVHDAVSCYMTTFLKWAESGFKANINDLAREYKVLNPAFVVV